MHFLRWSLAAWLITACVACSTPTLPLPPPSALVSPPDGSGLVTVSGDALPGAYVLCVNERTNDGVIDTADDDGHFSLTLEADTGDTLLIWQQVGTDRGPTQNLVVPSP